MKIILVEDHHSLRRVTAEFLRGAGHDVVDLAYAEDVNSALNKLLVDIFILDLNLPGEGGLALSQRLRQAFPKIGIIMATARDETKDLEAGFRSGADIYLTKPISPEFLLAAVDSLARRVRETSDEQIINLHLSSSKLTGVQGSVKLLPQECDVIKAFASSREQHLEAGEIAVLFGLSEDEYSPTALQIRITRLRKKIKSVYSEAEIKVIRNVGYRLSMQLKIL